MAGLYALYCKRNPSGGLDVLAEYDCSGYLQKYNFIKSNMFITLKRDAELMNINAGPKSPKLLNKYEDRTPDDPGNYIIFVLDNNSREVIQISNHLGKYVNKSEFDSAGRYKADIRFILTNTQKNMSNMDVSNLESLKDFECAIFPGTDWVWVPVVD